MQKILLADDEAHITSLLARRLRAMGFEVVIATDGEEALEFARSHMPSLVVTDLQMPYLNGLEFTEQLRATPGLESIPVLMLTARGHVVKREEIERLGITDLHPKPFSVRKLTDRVAELLGGASNRKAA